MSHPGSAQAEPSLGQRAGRILIGPDELAQDQDSPGQGVNEVRSGFAISGPHVLTAWHCTGKDPQAPLWFRLRDPETRHGYHYVPLRVTSFDAELDVAVLSVDPSRLAAELTEADAAGVLTRAAIPIAACLPEGAQVKVMGFSQSKYTFDGDTYEATIREPADMQSGIRCMKLYGEAFDSQQPVSVDGLSGGPVLKAVSRGQGKAPDYVAVGIVRLSLVSVRAAEAAANGAAYPDGTLGGEFLATRLADVAGLPEIGEALRADLSRTHRTPDYLRVIERRASKDLLGRRAQLAALADFARPGSARPPYAIWTGIAGSGKSLLAAHFALRPPPGADVVAFFVSRYPPQQRQDFLRDACDQLAALLDTVAPSAPELNRFTALWEDAGAAAAAQGRTLLLLLDGLDEEDDPPWIGSSLPRDGDATRRVVIFTTASARGADRAFGLPAGKVARHEVVTSDPPQDAANDIIAAVEGQLSDLMQNVLGLMAAAESPLSAQDITQVLHDEGLLEPSARNVGALVPRVKKALDDASSLGLVSPTLEDAGLYQFEFGVGKLVAQELAAALDGHREQITTWADEYAKDGWPENTPRYLLTGYPRMLHHVGDSPRLLALTTPDRIKALREATGDETAALDELSLVLGHLATAEVPDVAMACRTVLRREQILRAMAWYPLPLIPAKATLGEWAAAHQLASHLERPEQQAEALTMVGYAATDAGKGQVGHDLLVEALRAVARITQPYWRMYASQAVAQTALRAEWLIEPQTVGVAFTDPRAGAIALAAFADAARGARRWGDAVDFLTEAFRIAASADGEPAPGAGGPVPEAPGAATLPGMVIGQTALTVAGAAAMAGDSDSAIKAAILIPGLVDRINSLANAYLLSAAAGQPAGQVISALLGLREPATRIENHGERAFVLATLARALTACGHLVSDLLDAAESAADDTARTDVDPAFFAPGGAILPGLQPPAPAQAESARLGASTRAYACVATAAVFCRQPADERLAQAREFAARWQAVAWRPDEQNLWFWIVVAIGAALAAADPHAAREALEAAFTDPGQRVTGLTAAVPAAAVAGQPTDGLLAGAREAAGRVGDGTQATMQGLIQQAEYAAADVASMLSGLAGIADPARREAIGTLIRLSVADSNIVEPFQRAGVLSTIAAGIAIAGGVADELFRAARAATAGIVDPGQRVVAQINACQSAIGASCFGAAADIAVDLEDRGQRPLLLVSAASAAASAGRPAGELIEKARQAAMDAGELGNRPWLLTTVANAAITAGCLAAAERIADDVEEPSQRAGILAAAAGAAAGAGAKAASSGPGSAAVSAGSSAAELIEKARGIAKDIRDPAQQAWATGGIIAAALATGDDGLARHLATEASQDAMKPDPGIRATLLGVLARAADDRPAVAASLFREACRATDFEGFLRRAYAIVELSAQAAGRAEWPDFLRAEVDRAVLIPGEYERTQALGILAQAAGQSGDSHLAQYAAEQIRDPGAKVLALVNGGYAVRQNPEAADGFFGRAYQVAGLPFSRTIDWAPAAIAQAAAACLRTRVALSAAQQIPSSDQRRAALVTVDAVLRMVGPEPAYYQPPVVSDDWRAVLVQAAYTVGWFGVAARLADGIEDLNYRAYLLLGLADAAAKAGQPDHASAAARAVLDLKGKIDRSMAGQALATVVNQDENQAQACRDLVAGMTVCFHPALFAVAQRLAPDTLRVLVSELGIELAVS
ncbi:MAG TPA: AAA family ATPase [Streptosporangiaceae bacterium]|nr:AAA family ATPase [Streptosporangiaceae bacterium]